MMQKPKPGESQDEAAGLSIFPKSCRPPYFSCNKKSCRQVLTALFLLLVLLVGRYTLHAGQKLSSLCKHEPKAFQFRVLTGLHYVKSEADAQLDASNATVSFEYQQSPKQKTKDDEETFFCNRSHRRTDVCQLSGDVRVRGNLGSILLFSLDDAIRKEEKIRPYTRKWETSVMATIDEISLRKVEKFQQDSMNKCDVNYSVPAVVFSTGGYTGNVYHEFNDGLIPLFITSHSLKGEVVFLILEYHNWWMMKYGEMIRQLSHYEILDFNRDKRVHCFSHVTVGLLIHDELTVDPKLTPESVSMRDFQKLLSNAFVPQIQFVGNDANNHGSLEYKEQHSSNFSRGSLSSNYSPGSFIDLPTPGRRPQLVIIARRRSRVLLNQKELVKFARKLGFDVQVLTPNRGTEMAHMFSILNSCDVMIGVHGAAMTHFLFMRPGSIFIQIVPLGTDWAAITYYGEPATKAGLQYIGYKITPQESSLAEKYARDDPVLNDPESINSRGWWETKKVYLEGQDVRLSMGRFRKTLKEAYKRSMRRREPVQETV